MNMYLLHKVLLFSSFHLEEERLVETVIRRNLMQWLEKTSLNNSLLSRNFLHTSMHKTRSLKNTCYNLIRFTFLNLFKQMPDGILK
jgi:hypothetical protein